MANADVPLLDALTMKTTTLTPELLHRMDAYWRAANYLSVGQIYLDDNPLLSRPMLTDHFMASATGSPARRIRQCW